MTARERNPHLATNYTEMDGAQKSLEDHLRSVYSERNHFARTHMALIAWRDSEDDPAIRRRIDQILGVPPTS